MNREEVIRMARYAHRDLVTLDYPGHVGQLDPWTITLLERFAKLVAAAEREACAKVCDAKAERNFPWSSENADKYHAQADWANVCAEAIRARGEVPR